MSSGSLELTLVSASIAPYIPFENEPCDTYAILRCSKDHYRTKNAQDQGRLPVWNETFVFDLQEQDMSNELIIQVFNVKSEVDDLLGLARIPIYTMVGEEKATLCALLSPNQSEIGKLKAAWKWKPGSQKSMKGTSYEGGRQGFAESGNYTAAASAVYGSKVPDYAGDSRTADYPHVFNSNKTSSEPYAKLDAVSDAMAKLAVEKEGSGRSFGRSSSSYSGDSFKLGEEAKVQRDDHYHEPSASYGAYPTEPLGHSGYTNIRTSEERKGGLGDYSSTAIHARGLSDHSYSFSLPTNAYPAQKEGYPPYSGTAYPPPSGAYPPKNDTYPPHLDSAYPSERTDLFPQDKDRYLPYSGAQYPQPSPDKFPQARDEYLPYQGSKYPPPPSDANTPSLGAYPSNKEFYPPYQSPAYPPYHDRQSFSTSGDGEGSPYMEKGGGNKEKGGGKKEKEKGHGSHASPYGQPPPGDYQYPPAPGGYPPAHQGYSQGPHGYPPAQHGYPQAPQGYPPAPQGYPSAPHGYPSAAQAYANHSYPSASPHAAPYGYPSSAYDSHSEKHGHGSGHAAAAAGSYVGHSSSSSKPFKKHKEPKHKHDKHKKQKSFKGMKFKKFKF